jgi:uracil-DNA glycosylase
MSFDLSGLGNWADLPFFHDALPAIETALAADPRAVFPPARDVFAALTRTQPNDVKVVILGQDPYPQPGKAHGLAFSIQDSFPPRARRDSLHNIFQEIEDDLGTRRQRTDLTDWADQGVLLFNCLALTVPQGTAGGHRALGWKALTSQVLERLSDRPRAYLLWGGDAHKAGANVDPDSNFILRASHPSPLGVHKTGDTFEAFRGAKPFSRTNVWLRSHGQDPINWGDRED